MLASAPLYNPLNPSSLTIFRAAANALEVLNWPRTIILRRTVSHGYVRYEESTVTP